MNRKNSRGQIDFVITWVDGNDPAWIKEKSKYKASTEDDNRTQRFRDWNNLRYWFRGVEKFAPYVHKIYFITWGHIPAWLNTENKKLVIVNHKDYMPPDYMPSFNSNAIELMMYKIKGLSEQFVYFNDDMFLIRRTKPTDFFCHGLPCDSASLNVHCVDPNFGFNYAVYQAISVINKYFPFHATLRKNWRKWFCPFYGKQLLRTLYLLPCPRFPGIYQTHIANSFLKSTFEELWEKEGKAFDETCRHRFRNKLDYSQWTMRNYQLASGRFWPRSMSFGKSFFLEKNKDSIESVTLYIKKQMGKMIAINDGDLSDQEFLEDRKKVIDAFESILPEKSEFEK